MAVCLRSTAICTTCKCLAREDVLKRCLPSKHRIARKFGAWIFATWNTPPGEHRDGLLHLDFGETLVGRCWLGHFSVPGYRSFFAALTKRLTYGIREVSVFNNGSIFTSHETRRVCEQLGIEKKEIKKGRPCRTTSKRCSTSKDGWPIGASRKHAPGKTCWQRMRSGCWITIIKSTWRTKNGKMAVTLLPLFWAGSKACNLNQTWSIESFRRSART